MSAFTEADSIAIPGARSVPCLVALLPTAAASPVSAPERGTTTVLGSELQRGSWGWLPGLAVVASLGLLAVAVANVGARAGAAWSESLYWCGLVTVALPMAFRASAAATARRERIALVACLGLGLYLMKVIRSPVALTFNDELLHWRTLVDMLATQRLFSPNPVLTVSPLYPGLEITTTALSSLSGIHPFTAALVVIGAGRLVLVLSLYLFFEIVSGSSRAAGLASVIYMTYPGFLYLNSQYAYESLALPIGALALYLMAAAAASPDARTRIGALSALTLALGALTATHHLTAYALTAFLATVALSAVPARRRPPSTMARTWAWTALLSGVAALAWAVFLASSVVPYLAPQLWQGVVQLIRAASGSGLERRFFASGAEVAPPWQQAVSYLSVAIVALALPIGSLRAWRRYRHSALAMALAALALLYPFSFLFRLAPATMQLAVRLPSTLYVAVAFSVSLALTSAGDYRPLASSTPLAVAALGALFLGGATLGSQHWVHLPGPYLVSADMRSIDAESVDAARWAAAHLGPGNRVGTDRVNALLMAAYGAQTPLGLQRHHVDVGAVLLAPTFGDVQEATIADGDISYLVVDRRLPSGLPMVGVYVDDGESGAFRHEAPVSQAAIDKYDDVDGVSRLFDSGSIVIYDVRAIDARP